MIGFWIALVIALGVVSRVVGDETSDNLTLPGTDSTHATNLLAAKLPKEKNGTVPIVLVTDSGRLDSNQNTKVVNATTKSLSNADGVEKAVSPLSDKGSDQLSKDGQTGYVSLTLSIRQGSSKRTRRR